MKTFCIGDREIGGKRCYIIAEAGLSHDGSLGTAHSYIDAASLAGADAIKFQTHLAEAEGTALEKFRVSIFPQDATRRDYWKRTSFTEKQWIGLKEHALEKKIEFLSSPFSGEAVAMLYKIGIQAWKIGSGETSNTPLLEEICATRLPVLLSTGMSTEAEITSAVNLVKKHGNPLVLLQCTNRYPCPPEHLGLNMIQAFQKNYGVAAGFSDHSGMIAPGIAAWTLGASVIETHVTFHKKSFGPDVSSSLTFEEFEELVRGIRFLEKAFLNPVSKNMEAGELAETRKHFTKSIVAAADLPQGAVIDKNSVLFKKPGTGMPASEIQSILGRKLKRALKKDELLLKEDLTDE